MKEYPGQPEERNISCKTLSNSLMDILKDELPDCKVNEWFIATTHFANMVDKIVAKVIDSGVK